MIPIPDTSRTSAMELALKMNIKYREGFMKNRYIGRTFIMPGQQQRKKSVRQKLSAVPLEFKGKNVLLVDDSIVRGTTCHEIIQMARDAGANKVFLLVPRHRLNIQTSMVSICQYAVSLLPQVIR